MEDRPPSDAALAERARDGDERAFEELVRMHGDIAFRTAFLLTGSGAEAEEAAHVGFLKAWQALPRFRRGAEFRPWLLRIVANEAHNRRRTAGRREALARRAAVEDVSGDAVPSPEAAALDAERRQELLAAVNRLDERDRDVLACRYFLELGEEETATVLGLRRGTVKSRTARARAPSGGGRRMSELERSLLRLGRDLDVPPTPDVASRVLAELGPRPAPARPRARLALVLAALTLAGLLAALSIPEARSAVLRVFGIGGAQIELVDELPAVAPPYAELELTLGDRIPLEEARQRLPGLLELEEEPDAVYLGERGTVWLRYGEPDAVRLLVAQTPAATVDEPFILKKLVPAGTQVEGVEVRGTRGYLLRGEPHLVLLVDARGRTLDESARLARDVLVWEENGRTVRLEGELPPERAVELAEELRVRSPG